MLLIIKSANAITHPIMPITTSTEITITLLRRKIPQRFVSSTSFPTVVVLVERSTAYFYVRNGQRYANVFSMLYIIPLLAKYVKKSATVIFNNSLYEFLVGNTVGKCRNNYNPSTANRWLILLISSSCIIIYLFILSISFYR